MSPDKTARLEAIYAKLPKVQCRGLCQSDCAGILMSRIEAERINAATGRETAIPHPNPVMTGTFYMQMPGGSRRCPLLDILGRCSRYAIRPMICRVYGTYKDRLECPHGCQPDHWMTDDEMLDIMREIDEINR